MEIITNDAVLAPGFYTFRTSLTTKLAGSLVDALRNMGRISDDAAQLLFCRLSDTFLSLTDDEILVMIEGVLSPNSIHPGRE